MTGKELRVLMDKAIKEIAIPFFREKGFTGSYPHFRRIQEDRINLLTFQFNRSEPSFVVEISNCSPKGVQLGWGADIPPSKCTAHHMHRRHRIGSKQHNKDYWFDFSEESTNNETYTNGAKDNRRVMFLRGIKNLFLQSGKGENSNGVYTNRAKEILSYWQEAETWWAEDPHEQRLALVPDAAI
ncbi:DUF4304 domain-containing protein [Mucilaginibacter pedocola]|uniref:DUF4304 domain-containing protein n=1 Tax=Mucilaginibacter pedocola TaxID=1792845 RepID=A0A1S9PCV9_9SPHI|nr:DUF4304 domain-containing protein [Mucilaginibacter pedocola]OOQ58812.1 hypothetical protein BC343_09200 [Mucilaginibacter pedocola]